MRDVVGVYANRQSNGADLRVLDFEGPTRVSDGWRMGARCSNGETVWVQSAAFQATPLEFIEPGLRLTIDLAVKARRQGI